MNHIDHQGVIGKSVTTGMRNLWSSHRTIEKYDHPNALLKDDNSQTLAKLRNRAMSKRIVRYPVTSVPEMVASTIRGPGVPSNLPPGKNLKKALKGNRGVVVGGTQDGDWLGPWRFSFRH